MGQGAPRATRERSRPGGRRPVAAVVVAVVVVLGVVLLWPDGQDLNRAVVRLYVFLLDRGMPAAVTPDVYAGVLNVALFVVPGWLGVALLGWRPPRVVLGLTAVSAAVELVQWLPFVGRDASIGDVALNALGAALGAAGASLVGRRRRGLDRRGTGDQARIDEPVDEGGDVGGDRLGR